VAPRILASRTLVVTDTEGEAAQYLQVAWERYRAKALAGPFLVQADDARTWARRTDTHIGTPDQVIASLASDSIIPQSTEVAFQVHSIDPGHEATMRSLELIAGRVAPALGWDTDLLDAGTAETGRNTPARLG
jgi:alkanesulfonate monooxygenase SsuD/methylene tetrahydromethanopterin reductase-like flavin-dependent oxidoreductase (luciferase family)